MIIVKDSSNNGRFFLSVFFCIVAAVVSHAFGMGVDDGSYQEYGIQGSNTLLSIRNLWHRTADDADRLDLPTGFGRSSATLVRVGNYIYIPKLKTVSTEPNQLHVIDALTGTYVGLADIDFGTTGALVCRRAYDEIGLDSNGNVWIGSTYQPMAVVEDFTGSTKSEYYTLLTGSTYYTLRFSHLDFADPMRPKAVTRYVAYLPSVSALSSSRDDRVFANLRVEGDLAAQNFSLVAHFWNKSAGDAAGATLYRWTFSNSTSAQAPTSPYVRIAGCNMVQSIVLPGPDNSWWVNAKDCRETVDASSGLTAGATHVTLRKAGSAAPASTLPIPEGAAGTGASMALFDVAGIKCLAHCSRHDTEGISFSVLADASKIVGDNDLALMTPLWTVPQKPYSSAGAYRWARETHTGIHVAVNPDDSRTLYSYAPPSSLSAYRVGVSVPTSVSTAQRDTPSITLRGRTLTVKGATHLRVLNMTGAVLLVTPALGAIDLSHLSAGVYVVQVDGTTQKVLLR